MNTPRIRVGVGGWTFEPWRNNFYPAGWPKDRELEYASRQLTMLEINGTYYATQKPATFAKWRSETPEDFVFSLKAHRLTTNRKVLAEAGESVNFFCTSGIAELGPKLGPIVWQFAPTKRYDAADFEAFLKLLPKEAGGVPLRHALDVRHESFRCPEYLALVRRYGAVNVFTESDEYPAFADLTGSFVYARVMRADTSEPEGLAPAAAAQVAACARAWRDGGEPADLPRVEPAPSGAAAGAAPRDVFLLFIAAAKEKNPAAAMALQRLL
jgi:uncharacterized protein YecE (DUF72 family)